MSTSRSPGPVAFVPVDARDRLIGELLALPALGDFFLGHHWLTGRCLEIHVGDRPAGLAVVHGETLCYVRLDPGWLGAERDVTAELIRREKIRYGLVASWDAHHVDLLGGFATRIGKQAFQFELTDPTRLTPVTPALTLRPAQDGDAGWLRRQDEFAEEIAEHLPHGNVRIFEESGTPVGVGLVVPHEVAPDSHADIGDYVVPDARGRGLGRALLSSLAREVLESGRTPTCGCWWGNTASVRQIQMAGFHRVGTIFRLAVDPDACLP